MSKIPEKKHSLCEKSLVVDRLSKIPEREWAEILIRVKSSIKHRLHYTDSGAHSVSELGMPALDYYATEAIEKIISLSWSWNPENISLTDQLIRIANSLISRQVDSYKRRKDNLEPITYEENLSYDVFDEVYDADIDKVLECIDRIAQADELLSEYWSAIKAQFKSKEIAELMNIDVNKVYKQNDKLIYQAKKNCITI